MCNLVFWHHSIKTVAFMRTLSISRPRKYTFFVVADMQKKKKKNALLPEHFVVVFFTFEQWSNGFLVSFRGCFFIPYYSSSDNLQILANRHITLLPHILPLPLPLPSPPVNCFSIIQSSQHKKILWQGKTGQVFEIIVVCGSVVYYC